MGQRRPSLSKGGGGGVGVGQELLNLDVSFTSQGVDEEE